MVIIRIRVGSEIFFPSKLAAINNTNCLSSSLLYSNISTSGPPKHGPIGGGRRPPPPLLPELVDPAKFSWRRSVLLLQARSKHIYIYICDGPSDWLFAAALSSDSSLSQRKIYFSRSVSSSRQNTRIIIATLILGWLRRDTRGRKDELGVQRFQKFLSYRGSNLLPLVVKSSKRMMAFLVSDLLLSLARLIEWVCQWRWSWTGTNQPFPPPVYIYIYIYTYTGGSFSCSLFSGNSRL